MNIILRAQTNATDGTLLCQL